MATSTCFGHGLRIQSNFKLCVSAYCLVLRVNYCTYYEAMKIEYKDISYGDEPSTSTTEAKEKPHLSTLMNQTNIIDDLFEESYWVVIRFNLEETKGLKGE